MNVYIVGGTGFVGSHLAHKLVWNGHKVTVGGLSTEPAISLPERVETEKIDVTDSETLDFTGYDVVINLVGLSPLFQPRIPYHKVHVLGTENVIYACEEANVKRFIHMSALGADPRADTEYLRTKGEAQLLVEESSLEWTIFRPSVIFGKGGQFLEFTESLLTPFVTALPGDGRNKFQPIYVEDIGDLFVEAVENQQHIHRVYDLGGSEKLSLKDVAKLIERCKGRNLKVLPVPMPFVKTALILGDKIGLRFGLDQYRSLKKDNTVDENDIVEFEKSEGELETVEHYLRGD